MLFIKIKDLNRSIFIISPFWQHKRLFYSLWSQWFYRSLTRRRLSDSHIYNSFSTDNEFLVLLHIWNLVSSATALLTYWSYMHPPRKYLQLHSGDRLYLRLIAWRNINLSNWIPFAYLSPFIHQQDLPCCRFLLLVSISLVKMTALVKKIWLVGFLSLFKARPPPKMDYWLVRQSILLLQEIINLLIEHHQR